ncbi:hypothetical protein JZ751_025631 [Albula glossodonta]|uniref:Receptor expression-enhancing protein n=1 Tax=Albula glossodonta TaxID=121402 RepID=A0A8T2NDL7_9TELE|nr:hypothetical protein JZ751_025631 [Albula glossodonta]
MTGCDKVPLTQGRGEGGANTRTGHPDANLPNVILYNTRVDSCSRQNVSHYQVSRLIFGTLYPAYSSYKAVRSKDVKEYVKWMMYWIIFALFTTAETITDIFLCWKFVHPTLSSKEKDIDDYLCQAKDKSYDALLHFGRKGLNVAATAAVTAAAKVTTTSSPPRL